MSDARTAPDEQRTQTTLSTLGDEARPDENPPRPGSRIGRYMLLEPLGSGGMGVVYAAYDPELDRKVAVKLLHDVPLGGSSSGGRNRLLDEARALAQLSHPNVVVVHDVGLHEGRVFVAMEFVDGRTLRRWLAEDEPAPEEICRVYAEAGHGLAAAHRAGLAHRDFKPDNVMIDTEGRIKVLDFGLARSLQRQPAPSTPGALRIDDPNTVGLVGTPAYMSPEQFTGLRGDARSDQFSFCVALYESLFGTRPFKGRSFAELATSTLEDEVARPATPAGISSQVMDAIERGLSKDPARRFASMQDLLDALAPPESTPPRPWRLAASAAVGGAAVAAAAVWWPDPPTPCTTADAVVTEAWNPAIREELHRAIAGDAAREARVAEQVVEALDTYAASIARHYRSACESHASEDVDDDAYGRWTQCLDRPRHALEHVVEFFIASPQSAVERGPEVVAMLPVVAGCDGPSQVGDLADINDAQRLASAYALETKLDEVRMHIVGGERDLPERVLEEILAEAQEHRFPGIEARALHLRGLLGVVGGHPERRRADYRRAFALALRSGYHEVAIECGHALAHHYGFREGKLEEGEFWLDVSRALMARHGASPDSALKLKIEEGTQAHARGDLPGALALYESAVDLCNEHFAHFPSRCSEALSNQAETLRDLGRNDEAIEVYERVLATVIDRYGEHHPRLATVLTNYAVALRRNGRLEDALLQGQRAITIGEAYHGHENIEIVSLLGNVSDTLTKLGRLTEAMDMLERILVITHEHLGDDHLMMSYARDSRGRVALARGAWATARADFEHALRIRTNLYGDTHPTLVSVERGLGEALLGQGEPHRARAHYERVVELCATLPCEGEAIVAHAGLVEAALALGRHEEARAALDAARRALDTAEESAAYPRARVTLAQALVSSSSNPADGPDAIAAARRALVAAEGENDAAVLRLDARYRRSAD